MTSRDHGGGVVDSGRQSTATNFVITDSYENAEATWYVVSSVGVPLVELQVREEDLETVVA